MNTGIGRLFATLLAAAVLVATTACTPVAEHAPGDSSPGSKPATDATAAVTPAAGSGQQPGTATPSPGAASPAGTSAQSVIVVAIPPKEAPGTLTAWVDSQRLADAPASQVAATADFTYVAISGGMQPTGGYNIAVDQVRRDGNGWVVQARVIPPPPGAIVTQALTNPVGFFKLPKLDGAVQVSVLGPGSTAPTRGGVTTQVTAGLQWPEPGRLNITGMALVADLHFDLRSGSTVVGQADVQVKDGRYLSNILVKGVVPSNLELTVSTVERGGGTTLLRIPAPAAIASGETWSANFRVGPVRQTGPNTVFIQGRSRAFEAVFQVEIRAAGRVLTRERVQAAEGAPAYGAFSRTVQVPAGVPAGAEAWFILVSPKDGSDSVELVLPIQG